MEIAVVSDLHVFCSRSRWREHLHALHAAATSADMIVLNGDTFDFKWSHHATEEAAVAEAIRFLDDLTAKYDRCRFHVNLGNHDHYAPYLEALAALAKTRPNLTWDPYLLRVGNVVFLHGDVATGAADPDRLAAYRAKWLHKKRPNALMNRVYDAAFLLRAHIALSRLFYPAGRTMRRLHAYLAAVGHGPDTGLEHVYFGHTHVPLRARRYRGLTFHNGGAPLRHVRFSVLRTCV